jgi:hypothetical protein
MRFCLRRLRMFAPVLLLVGVLVQTAGAGSGYKDLAGDSAWADVVSVAVTDNAIGLITFKTKFSDGSKLSVGKDDGLYLFVNADRNRSTGRTVKTAAKYGGDGGKEKYGADYVLVLRFTDTYPAHRSGATSYDVERLSGSTSTSFKTTAAKSRCCAQGWEFSINKRELGSPKAFEFYVWSLSLADPNKPRWDYAPSKGVYTYKVTGG